VYNQRIVIKPNPKGLLPQIRIVFIRKSVRKASSLPTETFRVFIFREKRHTMTFQLVYYSQQDSRWKQDILGDNTDPKYNIGYVGCAVTSVAMLLSGHGYTETPKTLNQKLQSIGGFSDGAIYWSAVSKLYPQVVVKSSVPCSNANAPLDLIDASLAAGQPVIVMVDSVSGPGFNTHWVLLYAKDGNDYLMLDPWPYQPDVTKKTYLMPRYSDGRLLQRTIMHIIFYECYTASGGIALPGSGGTTSNTTGTTQTNTTTDTTTQGKVKARVKAEVTAGLNIRSSIDTSTMSNIVASAPAGTVLTVLDSDGESKIGGFNQWVRVNDGRGHEGYCAAWYLEKVSSGTTANTTGSTSGSTSGTGSSSTSTTTTTTTTTTTSTTPAANQMTVFVSPTVGRFGLNVYETASTKAAVLSNEKMRAVLIVLEPAAAAKKKVGVQGQWINVQATNGKQGFVEAARVKLP
jgi:hypothetical protein